MLRNSVLAGNAWCNMNQEALKDSSAASHATPASLQGLYRASSIRWPALEAQQLYASTDDDDAGEGDDMLVSLG
jgi:hypothetical protein